MSTRKLVITLVALAGAGAGGVALAEMLRRPKFDRALREFLAPKQAFPEDRLDRRSRDEASARPLFAESWLNEDEDDEDEPDEEDSIGGNESFEQYLEALRAGQKAARRQAAAKPAPGAGFSPDPDTYNLLKRLGLIPALEEALAEMAPTKPRAKRTAAKTAPAPQEAPAKPVRKPRTPRSRPSTSIADPAPQEVPAKPVRKPRTPRSRPSAGIADPTPQKVPVKPVRKPRTPRSRPSAGIAG
jgi:hypothetical protein